MSESSTSSNALGPLARSPVVSDCSSKIFFTPWSSNQDKTEWGGKFVEITLEELQETLAETHDTGKAFKRLMRAIAYNQGQSLAKIEETYVISQENVSMWLDRFESRGFDGALYDESKLEDANLLECEESGECA